MVRWLGLLGPQSLILGRCISACVSEKRVGCVAMFIVVPAPTQKRIFFENGDFLILYVSWPDYGKNWIKKFTLPVMLKKLDPKTNFETSPDFKKWPLRREKVKNDLNIKSKSKVRIKGSLENKSCSITWVPQPQKEPIRALKNGYKFRSNWRNHRK